MPYPRTRPDPSVFEDMTVEYSSVSTPVTPVFTPLSSADTLAALVRKGDFRGAEMLRQEMISHRMPIARDSLYQRAALNAIRERRPRLKPRDRIQAFQAWMSLVPDRHEQVCTFYAIRQHIFRSMDHLNLDVVRCFGLVLAAKGYFTNAGVLQVVATLAQYTSPSVTENYLRSLNTQCRMLSGTPPAEALMEAPFSVAIKKHAMARRTDAALRLLKIAHGQRIPVSHDTLQAVLKHASSHQHALAEICTLYPAFSTDLPTPYHSTPRRDLGAISNEFGDLAVRLRALRKAIVSSTPPAPYVLLRFITDCCARGKFHAVALLRKCAFRQSSRSAAAWVLSEMLYHRERKEHLRVLAAFSKYFYLVGVPRKSILSLLRGSAGKSVRPHAKSFGFGVAYHVHLPPYPLKQRLWPSRSHTSLVWEALVAVSRAHERKRLYGLLLQLVEGAKRAGETAELACSEDFLPSPDVSEKSKEHPKPVLELSLSSFDSAHFSPFIKAHAARGRPDCAAQVVADMVARGIQPSFVQWSMVARAYAQDGDAATALKVLDQLEAAERQSDVDPLDSTRVIQGKTVEDGTEKKEVCHHTQRQPSDSLLGIFTNVLRGFVLAKDIEHARRVKLRLTEHLGYQVGKRPATDAAIDLLTALEMEKT
ncbi:hypothetical protein EDC04DRAFT_3138188 [Pisolithus marmoratus]|nr:hypothetical protein EDC04DRAFT_3138188 [Pisolithus marmoratus]